MKTEATNIMNDGISGKLVLVMVLIIVLVSMLGLRSEVER